MVCVLSVPSLESLCLAQYQVLVTCLCQDIGTAVLKGVGKEEQVLAKVTKYVEDVQDFVWSRVVWYLCQEVSHRTLLGVIEALERKKASWTMTTDMAVFRLQVSAMMKLTDVMNLPSLRSLDLSEVPKMLRPNLLRSLHKFKDLRQLEMGSYSGGRPGSLLNTAVCAAMGNMTKLVQCSIQYCCTDTLLSSLVPACRETLRTLDIQHSNQVTDLSLPCLSSLTHLVSLSMEKTGLCVESQARIVLALQNSLLSLPGCGYLCDVLDWILEEDGGGEGGWRGKIKRWQERKNIRLRVRQFHWDDSYYFHTTDQMKMVGELCPEIQELHFMYENRYTCDPQVFQSWRNVSNLDWYGGDWYGDSLDTLVSSLGPSLTQLNLHYVDTMDLASILLIASCCQNLVRLELGAMVSQRAMYDEEDEPYIAQIKRAEEAELRRQLVPMLELEELIVNGPCYSQELVTVCSLALNVRKLRLGPSCQCTDSALLEVLESNQLQYLESFSAIDPPLLTLHTADTLVDVCPNLETLIDLSSWSRVGEQELEGFKERIRENNLRLHLGEEGPLLERGVNILQMCREQLREKYGKVGNWQSDCVPGGVGNWEGEE